MKWNMSIVYIYIYVIWKLTVFLSKMLQIDSECLFVGKQS